MYMVPPGNPYREPKRVYSTHSAGRFNSVLRGIGRAGRIVGKEVFKPGPKKEKKPARGAFTSKRFPRKNPNKDLRFIEQIIKGGGGNKYQKALAMLRFEAQTYDSKETNDPYFSRNEGNKTVERARKLYGDQVANEVAQKLQGAFVGKNSISIREAEKHLSSLTRYGQDVREGVKLIAKNYEKEYKTGHGAKYITPEKLEQVIKETSLQSGKQPAYLLEKAFQVSREEKNASQPAAKANWAKRNSGNWSPGGSKIDGGASGTTWKVAESGTRGGGGSASQNNENGSSLGSSMPSIKK